MRPPAPSHDPAAKPITPIFTGTRFFTRCYDTAPPNTILPDTFNLTEGMENYVDWLLGRKHGKLIDDLFCRENEKPIRHEGEKLITGWEAVALLDQMIAAQPEYPNSETHWVARSREFWEIYCSEEEGDALTLAFRAEYFRLAQEITNIWGPPAFQGNWEEAENGGFGHWGHVVEVACWFREGFRAYVAWTQEDKELAYEVVLTVSPKEPD